MAQPNITITRTDESPDLALRSFLPIITRFAHAAGITVDTKDISLKGRILATFSDALEEAQRRPNDMTELSEIVKTSEANIIKLPNISATEGQLIDAIKELQAKGYALPDYPGSPETPEQQVLKAKYDGLTGSVVNPVLRQGNAVRLIPSAVKAQSQASPHAMGEWTKDSKTVVAHMDSDDFYSTEKSSTMNASQAGRAKAVFVSDDGTETETVLKDDIVLKDGDIVDAAVMNRAALNEFLEGTMVDAKENDMLLSLHLKATMMKKTDGVIFGDAVLAFFEPVFDKHADTFDELGVNPANGLSDIKEKIQSLPDSQRQEIEADIAKCIDDRADIAMAGKNETHLEAPNKVIMDVSMANLARWGGQLPDKNGQERDTVAIIPDSTYARMHQAGVEYFQENGALDPTKMGTTLAVRLQAGGAQEYGSKDKTFEAPENGTIKIIAEDGTTLHEHKVKQDDIWRMCRTNDDGVKNWVKLGVEQARQTGNPAVFWLDEDRAHDVQLIAKVQAYLKDHDIEGLDVQIMSPEKAMRHTLERSAQGLDTVAVTGNVIGDHVTDYFPILEVASSAKMLSLVQLLNGGLVAETGSGGTAPGLITGEGVINGVANDNHFVWDDLGEAFALAESLKHMGTENAKTLGQALDAATTKYLEENRSPSPDGLDTRTSQFYLAKYWALELAEQSENRDMADVFILLARELELYEEDVLEELSANSSEPVDFGGHYAPDDRKADEIMQSSENLNRILAVG